MKANSIELRNARSSVYSDETWIRREPNSSEQDLKGENARMI